MRTDQAHPVAIDQWSVERTLARLVEQVEATRRFMVHVACGAVAALCLAAGALAVAITALCLAIR